MTSADFVVLGAGPAGLGAAYRLASAGFEVVVLEQADRVGGLAGSFEVAGQSVDFGSHRLHRSTPGPILELLASLLGDELQMRERKGRIRLHGGWHGFPLGARGLLSSMPPGFLARAAVSAGVATLRRRRSDTFANYVRTGLGSVIGEEFYFPYARKIWGTEPENLSGEQARRRISADSPWKVLRRIGASAGGRGRTFHYPARGFGRIADVLAEAAAERGAVIRIGEGASGIRPGAESNVVRTSRDRELTAGAVWSTIPVTRLDALFGADTEPARLEYRSMLLVYLPVQTDQYTPFDAHYLPESDTPVTRVSEPKNYRDGPDPATATVLCAEIPCSVTDEIWSWSSGDLGALASDALLRVGLPDPGAGDAVVVRVPTAYPVYRLDYERHLTPILDRIAAEPGIVMLGRQGLFAHDNTHHALAMAWAAADAVGADGSFDDDLWRLHLDAFRRHVVED